MHMFTSVNDRERTTYVDFGVTKKFSQVGEFTSLESMNREVQGAFMDFLTPASSPTMLVMDLL